MFILKEEDNEDHLACDECSKYPRKLWSLSTEKLAHSTELLLCRSCTFALAKVLTKWKHGSLT